MTRTRIKFCGLTRADDIREAIALGVDYLGLVFAPRSPRRVSLEHAQHLRQMIPAQIKVVALLMNQPEADVQAVVEMVRPDLLQFHGAENDLFCAGFHLPYWKAIAMGGNPAQGLAAVGDYPHASAFLFDGHAAGEPGGSGQRFDWTRLPASVGQQRVMLAGGLDAANVAYAIHTAAPWGVDVSSGIESAPGRKDAAKMRAFITAARHADQIAGTRQLLNIPPAPG